MMALAAHDPGWLRLAFAASLVLTMLVAVAVASGAAARIDRRVLAALRHRVPARPDGKPRRLTTAARDLTALGGDTLRLLVLVGCLVALLCDGRRATAGAMFGLFAIARLVLVVVKALVRRARPPAGDDTPVTYTSSFPSGHTFMAGVLYLSAAILIPTGQTALFPIAIGSALLLGLAIGLTRVSFAIHWPSDVAAGWLASIAWTTGCILLLARLGWLS